MPNLSSGDQIWKMAEKVVRLRAEGVVAHAAVARAPNERGVPTPHGSGSWTHTTVARVLARLTG
jgi:hypothetical protein